METTIVVSSKKTITLVQLNARQSTTCRLCIDNGDDVLILEWFSGYFYPKNALNNIIEQLELILNAAHQSSLSPRPVLFVGPDFGVKDFYHTDEEFLAFLKNQDDQKYGVEVRVLFQDEITSSKKVALDATQLQWFYYELQRTMPNVHCSNSYYAQYCGLEGAYHDASCLSSREKI